MGEDRAKRFRNGRSQAVRLPKELRFGGHEVRIWEEGRRVVLAPVEDDVWGPEFWEVFGRLGEDFDLADRRADPPRDLDFG